MTPIDVISCSGCNQPLGGLFTRPLPLPRWAKPDPPPPPPPLRPLLLLVRLLPSEPVTDVVLVVSSTEPLVEPESPFEPAPLLPVQPGCRVVGRGGGDVDDDEDDVDVVNNDADAAATFTDDVDPGDRGEGTLVVNDVVGNSGLGINTCVSSLKSDVGSSDVKKSIRGDELFDVGDDLNCLACCC